MNTDQNLSSFAAIFEQLNDPRVKRRQLYSLSEILLATLCGMSAGCDGWVDIGLFAKERVEVLCQY